MGKYEVVPGKESLASAIGNTGVEVVSSPFIVGMLEEASHRAVRGLYEADEATVGIRLEVSHLAAAYPRQPLLAVARLEEVNGRRMRFSVNAYQGDRLIMSGMHERALIQLNRFLGKDTTPADTIQGDKPAIDFYFDYHSPWSYFAATQIMALAARVGHRVSWKPMHLARLIERIDGRRPLDENAAFVKWYKADMLDTAARLGLSIAYHPQFPLRPVRALRATAYAITQEKAEAFVLSVMRAYWSDAKDISDPATLAQLGASVGLDPLAVTQAIEDPVYKSAIEANTLAAQAAGVFGAPTFICDGKLFWGNDRLDTLEAFALKGHT